MAIYDKLKNVKKSQSVTRGNDPHEPWEKIKGQIEREYKNSQTSEKDLIERLNILMLEKGKLEAEKQQMKQQASQSNQVKAMLEKDLEKAMAKIAELSGQVNMSQTRVRQMEQERDKNSSMMLSAGDLREEKLKTEKLNHIHSATVKVDDKLEKLHLLIADLAKNSRITIDQSNNIVTDHPFVERDMYEIRDDLNSLNKLKDESAFLSKKLPKQNLGPLNNLNLKKQPEPAPELLKPAKPKQDRPSMLVPRGSEVGPFTSSRHLLTHMDSGSNMRPESRWDDNSMMSDKMARLKSRGDDGLGSPRDVGYSVKQPSAFQVASTTPTNQAAAETKHKWTQTEPLGVDFFLVSLEEAKQKLIRFILTMKVELDQVVMMREVLEILARQDPSAKRNLKFIRKLLSNDNIGLLQDATNDGETIQTELVMYIKKLQGVEMQGNKVEVADMMMERNRMTKDDSMALNHLRRKKTTGLYAGSGQDSPRKPTNEEDSLIKKPEGPTAEELEAALKDVGKNSQLQQRQEKYLEGLRKSKNLKSMTVKEDPTLKRSMEHLTDRSFKRKPTKPSQPSSLQLVDFDVSDEEIIRKLYEHLSKFQAKSMPKFHKYPFKSIDQLGQELGPDASMALQAARSHADGLSTSELMTITTYDHFKKRFLDIVQIHKACDSKMCSHLLRFYERVGFNPHKPPEEREKQLPKFVIDQIMFGELDEFVEGPANSLKGHQTYSGGWGTSRSRNLTQQYLRPAAKLTNSSSRPT